ncbi:cyclic nucleotide-binding domain-containing protein, partial [Thiocystis minor]|uniref:cyclic nucleotide-binding domain-containing protein n=1 Tax=Thiocystis minor TaxID=61597 RepID=UPI00191312A1
MSILKPLQETPHWLEPFLAQCHTKTYEKNVDFIRQGQAAETLYYLIEGSVAAMIDDEEERRELLLAYINKGEFIGEMGLFVPQNTRSVIIRTRTKCKVAEITYQRPAILNLPPLPARAACGWWPRWLKCLQHEIEQVLPGIEGQVLG